MNYFSGSEWRRWDLHLHTPDTNKNDLYEGTNSQEKWDNFYQDILKYQSIDNNLRVSVVGITDYFSIDNFRKVMSDQVITDKFDLILPNIEMRITPVSSKSAMNIHFICNPSIVSQLETKLFSQLKFDYQGSTYRANRDDFIKIGKIFNDSFTDEQAYDYGVGQFVVEFSNLKNILKDKELRENTIVVVSNSSNDGASGIGNPSRPNESSDLTTLRDSIYCFTDMIFSSNENDRKYFTGKTSIGKDEIVKKYGKLLPCIHGSDAHTNSKIFKPDNDKYCWIKADCTFNGLKQVIYEPEERVIVSSECPNNKKDYHIIDKVIISDERFSPDPIMFNPNLTCFIGGKSTGKSIILNNMARQIDYDQYKEKYNGNDFIIPSFKVVWKDGFVSDGSTNKRHIVYIPQTYLNSLTDEQEEKTEIDKIIQDVVIQDEDINKKFNEFNEKLDNIGVELDRQIYDVLKLHDFLKNKSYELKENGTSEAISKEIKKLQVQRDRITKSLQINDKDVQEYDKLRIKQNELINKVKENKEQIEILESLELSIQFNNIDLLTEENFKKVQIFTSLQNKEVAEKWNGEKKKLSTLILTETETLEKELKEIIKEVKEKEKILEKAEMLKKANEEIIKENKKLEKAKELEQFLNDKKLNFEKGFNELIHKFSIFNQLHQEFVAYVNEKTCDFDDSLKFIATAPFRLEKFDEKVKSLFNNKKLKTIYKIYEDGMATDVDEDLLKKLISPLFDFDGLSYLKSGIKIEEAMRAILSNWFNVVYTVELDNDKIQTMSPGKKALVLLKLLINLAESDCPILIDQPEDDLDNRSIYDELVGFIKKKKHDRQIIIVTHNANIVLGSDAEEIIVANQQGTNSPNENFRFEYRSGSIENNEIVLDSKGKIKNGILNQKGIQGHICEILEGGKEAFNVRKNKYNMIK